MTKKERALNTARMWADEDGLLRIYQCMKLFSLSWSGVRGRTLLQEGDPRYLAATTEGSQKSRVWITLDSVEKCIAHWED